jgi:surface protein
MEGKITIRYLKEDKNKIRIFGQNFVSINRDSLMMEIEGKETALEEYYYGNENDSKKIIEIKLIGINKVINLSYMFFDCTSLISISDISTWDTSNVKDISVMFVGCKSLTSLPDISKWNTSNVKDM